MSFSGALTLTDLNDFITPSQACIKPVEEVKSAIVPREPGAAATEIQIDSSGGYYEVAEGTVRARTKLETAQISLNDCLACSGCITSAEAVLITMQSHAEVFAFLDRNPPATSIDHVLPVLSVSPQSLASLAASISSSALPVSPSRILHRIRAFCAQDLQIAHVYDTTFARHLSLMEHAKEFRERRATAKLPMLASACPGWVCYVEKTHGELIPFMSRTKSPQQVMGTLVKRWIGAQCSRSPDKVYHVTVMPCYDKKLEASRKDFYDEVYATRDVDCVLTTGELELMMRDKGWDLSRAVPGEDGDALPSRPDIVLPEMLQHPGSSSGSYLQDIINLVSAETPNPSLSSRRIRSADYEEFTLSNGDTGEIVFRGAKCYGFRNLQNVVRKVGKEHGLSVGRGAAAGTMGPARTNGPSLRAIARRRAGKKDTASSADASEAPARTYDYVEVMACPGGCVNGGGQIKAPSRASVDAEGFSRNWEQSGVAGEASSFLPDASERWGDKEWVKRVEAMYWHGLPTPPGSPSASSDALAIAPATSPFGVADVLARRVLVDLCQPIKGVAADAMDEAAEARRNELFRTSYRAVESDVAGLAVKW